ncbi:MAG TPA: GAF and ANTAR domain-containing protein [Jatrophihabitans sp.]|nr:GAF and ANTAR domain-containing protein [Jatrophihabitans sp.]
MDSSRIDSAALHSSLRRLSEQGEQSDLYRSLNRVIDATSQLFSVDGGGLMFADDQGELHYVIASAEPSRVLESVQIETGQGPCVDTYLHDRVTVCNDLSTDERYPVAAPQIVPHGIRAVLGVPIRLSGLPIGSLDIYVGRPYEFDESEIRALTSYGEVVDAMVQAAVAASHTGQLADQLSYALDYRAPIERGIGFLMARDRLDQAAAFAKLRSAARASRRKLDEVATALLAEGRLPGEHDAHPH